MAKGFAFRFCHRSYFAICICCQESLFGLKRARTWKGLRRLPFLQASTQDHEMSMLKTNISLKINVRGEGGMRQTDRQTEKESQKQRQRDRDSDRDRQTETAIETERQRHRETQTQRQRQRQN